MNVNPYHAERVNRNLLDNWDFRNPVNQRGKTEYTASGYTIDRWKWMSDDTQSAKIENDGITLQGIDWAQMVPNGVTKDGISYTMSVLTADGKLGSLQGTFAKPYGSDSNNWLYGALGDTGLSLNYWHRFGNEDTSHTLFSLQARNGPVKIVAAKLERGEKQTLAYQDKDGNWQLYETMDYDVEYQKCQKYQIVFGQKQFRDWFQPIGTLTTLNNSGLTRISVPSPTSLAKVPTAAITGKLRIEYVLPGASVYSNLLISEFQTLSIETGVGCISLLATFPDLKAGTVGRVDVSLPDSKLILDANL